VGATGFPEYSTMIPKKTATIGEILKDNGYATWWFGKNHNTPDWETTVAGPFESVADRTRLRIFLRLQRWCDPPVLSGPRLLRIASKRVSIF
jgi:arylsulfatase A-like enzyme